MASHRWLVSLVCVMSFLLVVDELLPSLSFPFLCRIEAASRVVSVVQHPPTDVPGVAFGLSASVTAVDSSQRSSSSTGDRVEVVLSRAPDGSAECNTTGTSCIIQAGILDLAACQLSLPCVGNFTLTACTLDNGEDDPACTTLVLGRNATSWSEAPLDSPPSLSIGLGGRISAYNEGDEAQLQFQVPKPNSSMLLVWGNSLATNLTVLTQVSMLHACMHCWIGSPRARLLI